LLLDPHPRQSLPDGSSIVGDYDGNLLRGVDSVRSQARPPSNRASASPLPPQVRSAFDGPVVASLDAQEAVFDYVFERLSARRGANGGLDHPLLLTEPLLAPPSSRERLAELAFETYGAPSVAFGSDAGFAWGGGGGASAAAGGAGVALLAGHSACTLLPFCNGSPQPRAAVRLELGGLALTRQLLALLQLAHPHFGASFGGQAFGRAEELKHALCYVAPDYAAEAAAAWALGNRRLPPARVQLPWLPRPVKPAAAPASEEELARRAAARRAAGDRFRAMAAAKRAAKLQQREAELTELSRRLAAYRAAAAAGEAAAAAAVLAAEGAAAGGTAFSGEPALARAAAVAELDCRRLRGESDLPEPPPDPDAPSEANWPQRFPLIGVPDEQLDEEGLKAKRRQKLMRGGEVARARAREARAAAERDAAQQQAALLQRFTEQPQAVLRELRAARAAIQARAEARRARRLGAASAGGRRGDAQRERMRLMAHAAGAGGGEAPAGKRAKKAGAGAGAGSDSEAGFGDDDADWQVYRQMAGADASDSEAERGDAAALAAVGAQLACLGCESGEGEEEEEEEEEEAGGAPGADAADWNTDEAHQISLTTERFRAPELLFQPTAIGGLAHCGLAEALTVLLRRAPAELAGALRPAGGAPLLLSGGCVRLAGLRARMETETQALCPPGAAFRLISSATPELDAWRGASARAAAGLARVCTSRAQWAEEGPRRLARRAAATF